jgi:hypothetical protein
MLSSTVLPLAWPYTSTLSRERPPSSWYTGTPSALPLMSQSAVSTAAMAVIITGPPRQ